MSLVRCFISPAWLEITFVEARESPGPGLGFIKFVRHNNKCHFSHSSGRARLRESKLKWQTEWFERHEIIKLSISLSQGL